MHAPAHSVGKAFDCRIENPVFAKVRIEHFDRRIRISLVWLPARLFFDPAPFRRGHVQITPRLSPLYRFKDTFERRRPSRSSAISTFAWAFVCRPSLKWLK